MKTNFVIFFTFSVCLQYMKAMKVTLTTPSPIIPKVTFKSKNCPNGMKLSMRFKLVIAENVKKKLKSVLFYKEVRMVLGYFTALPPLDARILVASSK